MGRTDLLIGSNNWLSAWPDLEVLSASELSTYFVARPEHPLAEVGAPTPAEILAYPLVLPAESFVTERELRHIYRQAGLPFNAPQYVCDDFNIVRSLILATDAIAPVVRLKSPGHTFKTQFHLLPTELGLEPQQLGIAAQRGRQLTPPMRAFVDIFGSFLQDSKL